VAVEVGRIGELATLGLFDRGTLRVDIAEICTGVGDRDTVAICIPNQHATGGKGLWFAVLDAAWAWEGTRRGVDGREGSQRVGWESTSSAHTHTLDRVGWDVRLTRVSPEFWEKFSFRGALEVKEQI